MKNLKTVMGNTTNKSFNVEQGIIYIVKRSFFYNGEGYYKLQKQDGTIFEAPSVFFK